MESGKFISRKNEKLLDKQQDSGFFSADFASLTHCPVFQEKPDSSRRRAVGKLQRIEVLTPQPPQPKRVLSASVGTARGLRSGWRRW
jgi:hypothetical protein